MTDPVDIAKNQDAILHWLKGRGHAVDFSPDPAHPPPMPRHGHYTPPTTRILAGFDGRPCPYCGYTMMSRSRRRPSRDHIIPRHAGGTFLDSDNCLVVCAPCNGDKGGRNLREFARWLSDHNDPRCERVDAVIDDLNRRGIRWR